MFLSRVVRNRGEIKIHRWSSSVVVVGVVDCLYKNNIWILKGVCEAL